MSIFAACLLAFTLPPEALAYAEAGCDFGAQAPTR